MSEPTIKPGTGMREALKQLHEIRGALLALGGALLLGFTVAGVVVGFAIAFPGWRALPEIAQGNTLAIARMDSVHAARMAVLEEAMARGERTDQFLLCLFSKPYEECLSILLPAGVQGGT